MEEYKQQCTECGKTFIVRVTTDNVPGCKEKEEVICPYCRTEVGYRMTSGFVYTYKHEE